MTGEGILTVSGSGFTSVEVWVTKLDHDLTKPGLKSLELADSIANINTNKASLERWRTYLINLGKVKELIAIQGFLIDESTESGYKKKKNLMLLTGNCLSVTLTWGTGLRQQSYTGEISKLKVNELPGLIGEQQESGYESEKYHAVQFALIVGEAKRT